MALTRKQQKEMFGKRTSTGFGSPSERVQFIESGLKLKVISVSDAGKIKDKEIQQRVSDKLAMKIIKEKEKQLKGMSEVERESVEDNIETDIRHDLRQKGFTV